MQKESHLCSKSPTKKKLRSKIRKSIEGSKYDTKKNDDDMSLLLTFESSKNIYKPLTRANGFGKSRSVHGGDQKKGMAKRFLCKFDYTWMFADSATNTFL